jgi:CRP-like cAMP-binding protein
LPLPAPEAIAAAFAAPPLFEGIAHALLEALSPRCLEVRSRAVFFAQNEPGDEAYLIARGIVGLYRTDLGGETRLFRKACRGDQIGEYACSAGSPARPVRWP